MRKREREREYMVKGKNKPFEVMEKRDMYKGSGIKIEDETEETQEAQQPEREEDRTPNGDSDCFAGDMIILSLSVFKEDVASALRS